MPHIAIEAGTLSEAQKRALIEKLTAVSSEIMHVLPEFYSVTIHEVEDANYDIGGKCIDVVKREYQQARRAQG